ncbi:MAG: NAD(P)/FAD-dependent oxidoreductase [bacterium]
MTNDTIWDLIVVGGGPAGMISAGKAAEGGAKVLLVEKNDTLGVKLLITGGGRCNVTNSEFDVRKFLERFKEDGKFLFSTFSQHSVKDTLDFFHQRGMETKVENELRTFPISDKSQSVLDVLVSYMRENGVEILSNSPVVNIAYEKDAESGDSKKIISVTLKNKKVLHAKNIIIATGGASAPRTGSTGDGFAWLKNIGHTIIPPSASLVPIAIKDKWVEELSGNSLTDIKISVFQNDKKQFFKKGKILFTHIGVSGPTILNMSRDIGDLLKYGPVVISLDLLPGEDYGFLNTRLQELFREHDKKKFRNALSNIVPSWIAPVIVEISKIDPEKECNSITREERIRLINLLKAVPLQVDHLLGADKAIITSGGVKLDEVDFKTMQSRLFPNLYLVGDILNIDRPSGGFSLQICWSTGYVAGKSVAEKLKN